MSAEPPTEPKFHMGDEVAYARPFPWDKENIAHGRIHLVSYFHSLALPSSSTWNYGVLDLEHEGLSALADEDELTLLAAAPPERQQVGWHLGWMRWGQGWEISLFPAKEYCLEDWERLAKPEEFEQEETWDDFTWMQLYCPTWKEIIRADAALAHLLCATCGEEIATKERVR